MSEHNNRDYYILRAKIERQQADQIADPAVSTLHRAMAEEYDKLIVQGEGGSSPSLADGAAQL